MTVVVTSLFIYPDSRGPAQELGAVEMLPSGPEGNRAKRHAVHLVSAHDYVIEHPKANVVLDITPGRLRSLVGQVVTLGEATLRLTVEPDQCSGVYAEVIRPGRVALDDLLLVESD